MSAILLFLFFIHFSSLGFTNHVGKDFHSDRYSAQIYANDLSIIEKIKISPKFEFK